MIELNTAPQERAAVFNCAKCPEFTKKKRRCADNREDFTDEDDASTFPIYVIKGGNLYSFCPAKTTWDKNLFSLYNLLVISAETGALYTSGGMDCQPDWFIDLLAWFLPLYLDSKFYSRAKAILGDQTKNVKGNDLVLPKRSMPTK